MTGCDASTLGKVCVCGPGARLALGQAVLDDLAGLRRDPVRKLHLELHQQVTTLGRALGQGQAFAPQAPDGPRFDDIAAGHRHHAAVEGGNVNGAATQSLERERKAGKWRRLSFEAFSEVFLTGLNGMKLTQSE